MPTALVIGAGPAGSTTALLLARRGWTVTLLEQHRFPRDKVCGECLSPLGIHTLARLHLTHRVRQHHPTTLRHTHLYGPTNEFAQVPLHHPMWGIRRSDLDSALLSAALESGVTLLCPTRAESIIPAHPPTVRLRDLTTNTLHALTADHLFLADGKSALGTSKPPPTPDLGVKAHFRNVTAPPETIGLYALPGHYVGLAPVNGNLWNLAFSAPAARLKQTGKPDNLLTLALQQNPTLRRHLATAERVDDWLVSPLPRFAVQSTWPPNITPVGNAAAALEPIGGEGIGLALASAVEAVNRLTSPADLRRTYSQLWSPRRLACRAVAHMISRPWFAGPAIELAAVNEPLSQAATRLIGKPLTPAPSAPSY